MKKSILKLVFLLIGCAPSLTYGRSESYEAWVIYTAFDTVSSHMKGPFDLDELKSTYPTERLLSRAETDALISALERAKIGKSTVAERRQMRGPIYLAIFRSEHRRRPVYVSNGCHVLNLESGDLYRLEPEAALSIVGIQSRNYEARLCKEPGLGIKLSPR